MWINGTEKNSQSSNIWTRMYRELKTFQNIQYMEAMDYAKIVLKQLVGNNLKLELYLSPYTKWFPDGVVKCRAVNKSKGSEERT